VHLRRLAAQVQKSEQRKGIVPGKGSTHALSAKIRAALRLRDQGMSQREAATKSGVNRKTLAKYWQVCNPADIALKPRDVSCGRPPFLDVRHQQMLLICVHTSDAFGQPVGPADAKCVIRFLKYHQSQQSSGSEDVTLAIPSETDIDAMMSMSAVIKVSRPVFNKLMTSIGFQRPKTVRHCHAGARKQVGTEAALHSFYDVLKLVYTQCNIVTKDDCKRMCVFPFHVICFVSDVIAMQICW